MLTLALDASTYAGSVALVRPGEILAQASVAMRGEREERLMPAVAELIAGAGIDVGELEAVACGSGPGSFTSLRIAASIAKGIAVGRALRLWVAPSPLLIVAGAEPALPAGSYCAMLDAMRGDAFGLDVMIDDDGTLRMEGDCWLAPVAESMDRAASRGATVMGPLGQPARAPHARGFARLLAQGLVGPADVTTWEPDYGRKAEAQVRWEAAHGRPLEAR